MASIMKANIDLNKIPKDKIYKGKKGNYLPIVITINDELGNYGDSGPIIVEQTKDERDAKVDKVYLGNVKIVWTNGTNVDAAPKEDGQQQSAPRAAVVEDDGLPF
jgi:hypothetical protein|tara:strand:+ start:219 stop:533 length:315 start_codon:yes stop_codon:yes gene_type:complete